MFDYQLSKQHRNCTLTPKTPVLAGAQGFDHHRPQLATRDPDHLQLRQSARAAAVSHGNNESDSD